MSATVPQRFSLEALDKYAAETFITHERHPLADLHIYGYYEDSGRPRLWDATTRHCRGLILDGEGNVVERPFRKFFAFQQYIGPDLMLLNDRQVIPVPEGPFRITEKIDGTMCILYWVGDTPYLATQRSFRNAKAAVATDILRRKYMAAAKRLDRRSTWIFEAVYPETNVLIDYGDTRDLYLIGRIDKETGMPLPLPETGFPTCRDFTEEYGHITDLEKLAALDLPNQEGFVLYYGDGTMVKLKFPWYVKKHSIIDRLVNNEKAYRRLFAELAALEGRPLPFLLPNVLRCQAMSEPDVFVRRTVRERLKYGYKKAVPSFYELMGLDHWLDAVIDGTGRDEDPLFAPEPVFDFEARMKEPQTYETTMWRWRERWTR